MTLDKWRGTPGVMGRIVERWDVYQLRRVVRLVAYVAADEPRRCPRCGSFAWVYKGGIQVCADCGK